MREESPSSVPTLPRAGEWLGNYEVLAPVAAGGMAVVFAVRPHGLGDRGADVLALKVPAPHSACDASFRAMFLDEVRIASRVRHPNVVRVFDHGVAHGLPYFVMEYLRGQRLDRVCKRARRAVGQLDPRLVAAIVARAADGLHAAHETTDDEGTPLGIVHRDVSPQNIHVGYDGVVRVLDFGIAKAHVKTVRTVSGQLRGKLRFLAPEQIARDAAIDQRVDVFALGVVAWEALTGRSLFHDQSEAKVLWNVLHAPIPDVRTFAPYVAPALADAVAACVERAPEKRVRTAAEAARRFRDASELDDEGAAAALRALLGTLFATELEAEARAPAPGVVCGSSPLPAGSRSARARAEDLTADALPSRARASRRSRRRALQVAGLLGVAAALSVGAIASTALRAGEPRSRSMETTASALSTLARPEQKAVPVTRPVEPADRAPLPEVPRAATSGKPAASAPEGGPGGSAAPADGSPPRTRPSVARTTRTGSAERRGNLLAWTKRGSIFANPYDHPSSADPRRAARRE